MSHAFRRSLGVFDLTMIVVGAIIGSGIFLTPSMIMRHLGDPSTVIGVWVLGGLMAIAGALTFTELAHARPHVGGMYAWLSAAFSPFAGFAYGWCMLLVMNSGSLAALFTACVTYLAVFVPMSGPLQKVVAIGLCLSLTVVNILGVKQGSVVSNLFSLAKIVGLAALILGALFFAPSSPPPQSVSLPPPGNLIAAVAMAMVGVLWSYGGWQYATFPAGEARRAEWNIPVSILVGVAIVVLLYIGANLSYLSVLSPAEIAAEERVASLTAERIAGRAGAGIISALIAVSTFGTASVYTLAAPRIYYAMAHDGVFFRSVAILHPRWGTPATALMIQAGVVCVLILSGTFEELISYVAFIDWVFYALAAASVFVFRRRPQEGGRRFLTPGYPLTPALFILVSIWFVVYLFYNEPVKSGIGLTILAASVPAYVLWSRRAGKATSRI
ncbi:MAG: amino acid permease [Bacteroidota bacterium]|nr:amino acid permease [Bacteroidota bacterium]